MLGCEEGYLVYICLGCHHGHAKGRMDLSLRLCHDFVIIVSKKNQIPDVATGGSPHLERDR